MTLAVFHVAIFPLNVDFPLKRDAKLVIEDVSHVEISPYVAVAVVGLLNHAATAVPILLVVSTITHEVLAAADE